MKLQVIQILNHYQTPMYEVAMKINPVFLTLHKWLPDSVFYVEHVRVQNTIAYRVRLFSSISWVVR
jgi:hypothetical protein